MAARQQSLVLELPRVKWRGLRRAARALHRIARMSQSEKQLWMERIARALAELKKTPVDPPATDDAREAPAQPSQGK